MWGIVVAGLAFAAAGFGETALVIAFTVVRVALGAFFCASGFNKLFNPGRRATMLATLADLKIPFPQYNLWFVSGVEFLGGAALAIGLLTPFAALGLLAICTVACATDGPRRVKSYAPINRADWLADWLYLPETWYALTLGIVLAYGAGPWSIDRALHLWVAG